MLLMKHDDEELALITNQFISDDAARSDPKDEADIWLDEYLHRFYDKNKNDEL